MITAALVVDVITALISVNAIVWSACVAEMHAFRPSPFLKE